MFCAMAGVKKDTTLDHSRKAEKTESSKEKNATLGHSQNTENRYCTGSREDVHIVFI